MVIQAIKRTLTYIQNEMRVTGRFGAKETGSGFRLIWLLWLSVDVGEMVIQIRWSLL